MTPPSTRQTIQLTVLPIGDLIAGGGYVEVAERLVPAERSWDGSTLAWVGVVSSRLSAAARGIDRLYPGRGGPLSELSNALNGRYLTIVNSIAASSYPIHSATEGWASGKYAEQRRKIVQELDRHLAKISVRAVDAETSLLEIGSILERVEALLRKGVSDR